MTDAEIEASGATLDEAFENAGMAVEDLMVDTQTVLGTVHQEIHLEENNLGSLLYEWIEALIVLQDNDGLLFSKISCKLSKNPGKNYSLQAKLSGEKFDPKKHEQKTAIKAPTFHDMKIVESPEHVTLRFLVDL
jgi:SHS2 domain-containing protein